MNGAEFNRNMSNHSLEELAPYEGMSVAWSIDGKRILASAPTLEELDTRIRELGLRDYVVGYIPSFTASDLGGALLFQDVPEEDEA